MPRPRIIAETKRPIPESRPPRASEVRPHEWLTEDSRALFDGKASASTPLPVYLAASAETKVREHASRDALRRLEVMGLLLCEVRSWSGIEYSVITDSVTTALRSSPAKVRFDPGAFPKLFCQLDESGFDYMILGWYHSHPGHTCFLSVRDLETQKAIFTERYHCAMVVDPLNREIKAFRLSGDGYEEIPFGVVSDRVAVNGNSGRRRTRRLKVRPAAQV
jgi:proteasome lid subunit RPN8/RPN11